MPTSTTVVAGTAPSRPSRARIGQAGVEVRSLAPSQQLTDHQLTLDAVGVLIRLAPASPAPGVPAQFTALAVGEVFADSLAVPGNATGELDDGLPGDLGAGAGSPTAPSTDTGSTAGPADLSGAFSNVAAAGPAFASDVNSIGNGSSLGSSGSSGSSGTGGGSSAAGRSSQDASPSSRPTRAH